MRKSRTLIISLVVVLLSIGLYSVSLAAPTPIGTAASPLGVEATSGSEAASASYSHRLIVQLKSPSLTEWAATSNQSLLAGGRLMANAPAAQAYINQLESEQAAFVTAMTAAVPEVSAASYLNESGASIAATYQVVLNAVAVEVDTSATTVEAARRELSRLPGVAAVYLDYAHTPDLYASLPLINVDALWNNPSIGGMDSAGEGIKIASMDGGLHHDAAMFSGEGYDYPEGYPEGGLGDAANNNGKIIVSRAYFRPWDPPAEGDENTWPGVNGTSHGTHTGSTAGGNAVTAEYFGLEIPISGVAPRAWMMSYRVFYNSVTANGSFYNVEGIAALEDILLDGADVVNNSWGGGPSSVGGTGDALDTALVNLANAGTFVTMSAGNAGPSQLSTDHPSDEYIVVAATTTTGTLQTGRLDVTAPQPVVSDSLELIPFTPATSFGDPIQLGETLVHEYIPSAVVAPDNIAACEPFEPGTFEGHAALVQRGGNPGEDACDFSLKAYNAQQAGAEFVMIYNNPRPDEESININMSAGEQAENVNVSVILIQRSRGLALVDWYNQHPEEAQITLSTSAYQAGNTPDVLAEFSSRGPAANNTLSPDIAAPGVNILAQGYGADNTGENEHLGFGQVSGTSMAAPHVSGAAALLRQVHPDWSNADIKSALMSTSKYMDIYNGDGSPAQPTDMGAGRLDLTNAADPGVILSPPSGSFGLIPEDSTMSMTVTVRSVADTAETYELSTLYTGDGFDETSELAGFTVSPTSVELEPGASADVVVTFDAAEGMGLGDNQGYIIMDGETHDAHMPVWAFVTEVGDHNQILIIDNDGSSSLNLPDYSDYYSGTLNALGYTWDYLDVDAWAGAASEFLTLEELLPYDAVIYFTGDNYQPNGTFTVPTPLTEGDQNVLNQYGHNGGTIIATGQDLAAVLGSADTSGTFFYEFTLGGNWLRDSVTDFLTPTQSIVSTEADAFEGMVFDVTLNGDGAGNQFYIDEISEFAEDAPDPRDDASQYFPILQYPDEGMVGMAHRQQPTLEQPEITYAGKSIYLSFGLEGVNNVVSPTLAGGMEHNTREELLQRALDYAWDQPTVSLSAEADDDNTVNFTAQFSSNITTSVGVSYFWDYGNGQDFEGPYASNSINFQYAEGTCNADTVARVEAVDSLGNHAVAEVTGFCNDPTAVDLSGVSAGSPNGVNPLWLAGLFTLSAGTLVILARRRASR